MFFGGGGGHGRGGGRGHRGPRKGQDVVHQLQVTLEQLYNGTTKKLSLNRKILCKACKGEGVELQYADRRDKVLDCKPCRGTGMTVREVGNYFFQYRNLLQMYNVVMVPKAKDIQKPFLSHKPAN